jgi:hypothetical protein
LGLWTLRSEMQTGEIDTHKSVYSLFLTDVVSLFLVCCYQQLYPKRHVLATEMLIPDD